MAENQNFKGELKQKMKPHLQEREMHFSIITNNFQKFLKLREYQRW